MTQPREIERVLDQWFADGPRELSDRALTDALSDIDHTRQLGAHVVPWRFSEMPTPVRLLLVAALMAVSAGAALLISAGARNNEPTPSPSPSPAQLGPGELVGLDAAGSWMADRQGSFGFPAGDYFLSVPLAGGHLFGNAADSPEVDLGTITGQGQGATALGATPGCPNTGYYTHELSEDGFTFTITATSDVCVDRATILEGTWHRDFINRRVLPTTRYRVPVNGVDVDLTVPSSFVSPTGDYTTFGGSGNPISVGKFGTGDWAFILESDAPGLYTAVDRCHIPLGHRTMPATIDQYLSWNRSSRGLEVGEPVRLTVGGHAAVRVDVTGTSDCQPDDMDSLEWTFVVKGMQAREWAIDYGNGLLVALIVDEDPMVLLSPEVIAAGQAFIESMEITPTP